MTSEPLPFLPPGAAATDTGLLTRVLDVLPCPVAVVGPEGDIAAANPAWRRLIGQPDPGGHAAVRLISVFPGTGHLAHSTSLSTGPHSCRAVKLEGDAASAATWWDLDAVQHPDKPGYVLLTAREVTENVLSAREAEDARDALTPIGARLHLAQDAVGIGTWEWDLASGRLAWSPYQFQLHGLDPATAAPPSLSAWLAMVHPADRPRIERRLANPVPEGGSVAGYLEFRIRRADTGAERWLLAMGRATELDAGRRPARMLGVNIDVTERRMEQETLRERDAALRLAANAAKVYAWDWDIATGRVVWADGLEQELGMTPGNFGGTVEAFRSLVHPADAAAVEAALARALSGESPDYRAVFRMRRADGSLRWSATRALVLRDEAGGPVRMAGMDHDITEFKSAEAAAREREQQQTAVARLGQYALRARSSLAVMDEAAGILSETLAVDFVKILEVLPDRQSLIMRAGRGWQAPYSPGQTVIPADPASLAGYAAAGNADVIVVENLAAETRFTRSPMLLEHGVVSGITVRIGGGGGAEPAFGVVGAHSRQVRPFDEHDVRFIEAIANILASAIQRERTESALKAMADLLPQLTFQATARGAAEFGNQRWTEYSGQTAAEAGAEGWAAALHPDDRDATLAAWSRSVSTGEAFERELRLKGRDGAYRWFLTRAMPEHGQDGAILRWLGTSTDISFLVDAREDAMRQAGEMQALVAERTRALAKAAEDLGAEMRRREDMQSVLLQAQKLEALGQLTAGVAHDFNNVLTAILGSFELIAARTTEPRTKEFAKHGKNAADRAVALTRQLLDFGRHEAFAPAALDLHDSLLSADSLIARAIGASIRRVLNVQDDIWPVMADAHELEIALLNLAVNARDAMREGGTLGLTARNLEPADVPDTLAAADYVSIAVSDNGTGMPPDVVARATDPFFTTKAAGKGTGLGLAMVRAFAERAKGTLRINSTPGAGTTIELILPRAFDPDTPSVAGNEAAMEASPAAVPADPGTPGGSQIGTPASEPGPNDKLLRRLRSPELLSAYLCWRAARFGEKLPRADDPVLSGLLRSPNAFLVAVQKDVNGDQLQYLSVGSALTARAEHAIDDTGVINRQVDKAEDEIIGTLDGAYRRCVRTLAPSYEYADYDFGDGRPAGFERLLLPVSDDGNMITHLAGFAVFRDAPLSPAGNHRPRTNARND